MPNPQFLAAVRHRLINVLSGAALRAQREAAAQYSPGDVVAFVDIQNLHHFLKENCRVPATQVHIPNLVREFASSHGLELTCIIGVTGIHDPAKEPQKHEAMARRIRWMQRNGMQVYSLPLIYQTDRSTGAVRAMEKGVDVRLGSEIIRATVRGLRNILVISQDRDLSESIRVAREIAHERDGQLVEAYSPVLTGADWPHNGKCGMSGVPLTRKLPMSVDLVRRHVRETHDAQAPDSQVAGLSSA